MSPVGFSRPAGDIAIIGNMDIVKLRRIIGDNTAPYQWEDADLQVYVEDPTFSNVYYAAAEVLNDRYRELVMSGAGINFKSNDLSINDYNNLVLLRDMIANLRAQALDVENRTAGGFFVAYPGKVM